VRGLSGYLTLGRARFFLADLEQLIRCDVECRCQPSQRRETRPLARLNSDDRVDAYPALRGELRLREQASLSPFAQSDLHGASLVVLSPFYQKREIPGGVLTYLGDIW
jgi:hypothetical protein